MIKIIVPFTMLSTMLIACNNNHDHEHHIAENSQLEPQVFTIYTDKTELFVEFNQLVVGAECKFAAHFTELGINFLPFTEGNITLTINVDGNQVSTTATAPQIPGIFRLRLMPVKTGLATLTFDIKTKHFTDQIIIDSISIFATEVNAIAAQVQHAEDNDIVYLKEQAWKVAFANAPVKRQTFYEIIKSSGQILAAPGDETIVTATADGLILFSGNKTIIGSAVTAGTPLFSISGGQLASDNIDANFSSAKTNYENAKVNFNRASELVKDKIISEKEYQQIKLDFDNAKIMFDALAKNYSANGQAVNASTGGFIKNIYVAEGQFVTAGTPLATIAKNKNLILQANVSQKYFSKLSSITTANFKTLESDEVMSITDLNGKIISYGKTASASSPFIPITFQIINASNLIPGAAVEVYLQSGAIENALVIPVTALIEEQGNFFVYVQTSGERFQKREIKTGPSDGINMLIYSGIVEGERIVTKGAYQIKLSSAAGTIPAHGHEH